MEGANPISKCKVMLFFYNRISSLGFNCQLALIVNSRSIMKKWRSMTHGKID